MDPSIRYWVVTTQQRRRRDAAALERTARSARRQPEPPAGPLRLARALRPLVHRVVRTGRLAGPASIARRPDPAG